MLLEFLKRAWRPYFASVASVSVMLGIVFMVTLGIVDVLGLPMLVVANMMIAAPVMLFLGMPAAYWAWHKQQRRAVSFSHLGAGTLGFGAGFLLHFAFLMCLGGFLLPLEVVWWTILCGGAYGAVFAFLFSYLGGLRLVKDEPGLESIRPS